MAADFLSRVNDLPARYETLGPTVELIERYLGQARRAWVVARIGGTRGFARRDRLSGTANGRVIRMIAIP